MSLPSAPRNRAADMTGQRFGSLVVLHRSGKTSAGNVTWACLCDCGNVTNSAGSDLRGGRTKTCGCGAQAATRRRHTEGRDLLGRRFGRLVVVAFAGLNSYPRATWRCACDCGQEVIVTGHHLGDGTTVSCGCRAGDPRPGGLREHVTYQAAHDRVKRLHGSASSHPCVDCGGQAEDWSYDKTDPDERHDDRGRPYSLNPSRYAPRCRVCHTAFDRGTTTDVPSPTGRRESTRRSTSS